jgi:hypothetical protein
MLKLLYSTPEDVTVLLCLSIAHVQEAAAQLEGAGAAAASLLPAAAETLAGQAAAIRDQTAPAVSTRIHC